jgi:hypothetical protein
MIEKFDIDLKETELSMSIGIIWLIVGSVCGLF